MAGEKTEKATPKKLAEARKKGQVAKSMDLNGAIVLLSGLLALNVAGPMVWRRCSEMMLHSLELVRTPDVVTREGLGELLGTFTGGMALAVAPIAAACLIAGLVSSVLQVGFKPSPGALKPMPQKLNPLSGAKQIFGVNALFEGSKTIVKFLAVGSIAAMAVFPQLDELAALVGMPPQVLVPELTAIVFGVMLRGAAAYFVIALCDLIYQKWRFAKQNRMEKHEVKEEFKQQSVPAEVKSAQKRRAMQAAQQRMMDAVPTADVVVMNPTHYAVALKYDPDEPSPRVVAKGTDRVALTIRARAEEHGVPVVVDPPLARGLHGALEIGHFVPEDFFAAVAGLLAYVYRVAAQRRPRMSPIAA